MPASTSRLALPYPVPADTVDVPRDVQALADKIDTVSGISPPIVTALPGSPVDGQEVLYKVTVSSIEHLWHFRYRAASANTNKWDFIGGPQIEFYNYNYSQDNRTSYGVNDAPVQLTLPLAGAYDITVEASMCNDSSPNGESWFSYAIGATAANDLFGLHAGYFGGKQATLSHTRRHAGLAAGSVVQGQVRSPAGFWISAYRGLRAKPVRVS